MNPVNHHVSSLCKSAYFHIRAFRQAFRYAAPIVWNSIPSHSTSDIHLLLVPLNVIWKRTFSLSPVSHVLHLATPEPSTRSSKLVLYKSCNNNNNNNKLGQTDLVIGLWSVLQWVCACVTRSRFVPLWLTHRPMQLVTGCTISSASWARKRLWSLRPLKVRPYVNIKGREDDGGRESTRNGGRGTTPTTASQIVF